MAITTSTSIVKLMFKKGDRRCIGNYRPLSLSCIDYKKIEKVTSKRIKPILTDIIGTEQRGFIQGADITGNLMLVKEIIECCTETNTEAYVTMMDFKKAHGIIERTTMMKCMRFMNISEHLIELVELLYTKSSAIIIMNNEKRERFRTQGGVRQG